MAQQLKKIKTYSFCRCQFNT